MKKLYMLAIGAALLVSGCRTPMGKYGAEPQASQSSRDPVGEASIYGESGNTLPQVTHDLASRADFESDLPFHNPVNAISAPVDRPDTHVLAFSQHPLERTPPVEYGDNPARIVRRASYEVQPSQGPAELVVPETLELPAPETADGLALYDLEQMALAQNPALGQASGRIQALQGKWLQVGLPPNPEAGYIGEQMGSDGASGQQGGFISQEFVTGKKLQLNRAIVEQEIARAEAEYAATEMAVRTDVQIAFYNVLLAQRLFAVSRDLVGIADKAVKASQDLFKAEEVGRAAVLQSQVEANTARILVQQAANEKRAAWRRLTAVIGAPDLPQQNVVGDLQDMRHDYEYDVVLAQLYSSNPELAAAFAEIERARWSLSRAEAEPIPNVTAQFVVQNDTANGDTLGTVQIGIPLPIINRNQGGVQQSMGDIVTAEQRLARIEMRLRHDLAEVFQVFADARVQVDLYGDQILPQAKETLELTEKGYRAGEMDFLTWLTAQRTYAQTNINYLNALRELWNKSAEIDGLLLKGSLNADR